jgi:hypothetical protein
VPDPSDPLATYALSKGYSARSRTVIVEGRTDHDLFELAARLEREVSGTNLLADLAFIPAGERDQGGTNGVVREMMRLKGFASITLLRNGRPRYRIAALVDNDKFGRQAVKYMRQYDVSIIECKDVFILWPEMPLTGNRDPIGMQRMLETANARYKGLDWEPEDLLPSSFVEAFERECSTGIARKTVREDKIHRDFTPDGKARFHRFIKENAIHRDMAKVIETLKVLRCYLGLI